MAPLGTPLKVFCAYAEGDEAFYQQLAAHLRPLERQGILSLWHDRLVTAGTDWSREVDAQLSSAALILLLISADFFTSDYCYGVEMRAALQRDREGLARVIPILMRSVDWRGAPFAHLQVLPTDGKPVTAWADLDMAFTDIVAGVRRVIEERTWDVVATPSSSLPDVWMIPYRRNPFFTGREQILEHLYQQLHAGNIAAVTQTQAIHGLGGIGKTQTAVEYAYRYRQDYRWVFWITAASHDTLITDVVSIADLLRLPRANETDATMALAAFKRWLVTEQGWLLILDNADDLVVVNDLLPSTTSGHILITTRAHTLGSLARPLLLEQMSKEEGSLLLLRRAGILAGDASLSQVSSEQQGQAQAIVEKLGSLPLALDQAGAYIEETQCTLAGYLEIYQKHQQELLERRGQFTTDYPASVFTTWSLAFDKIEQEHAAAADLLCVCAFLAPEDIPEEFFLQGASRLGPLLAQTLLDRRSLNIAIEAILKFSLIQRNPSTGTLNIHRLVQVVLKGRMDQETQDKWAMRVVQAMSGVFPDPQVSAWPFCRQLLSHALHCITFIEQYQWTNPEACLLLKRTGRYLRAHAQYQEAERLYHYTLAIEEQVLGTNHPDTAVILSNLGLVYSDQGRYKEAEDNHQRVLRIREQVLGASHPDVAVTLNNLGSVYSNQGRYAEAEDCYQRALTVQELVLGASHPETAATLNNLGAVYNNQRRYNEAETCYLYVLKIREQVLGADHPETANTLHRLGVLCGDRGRCKEAEGYCQRALKIWEQAFGASHPSTARTLYHLGELCWQQGQYKEAESYLQRALMIQEQVLGASHDNVAATLHGLGLVYSDQGRYKEAETCYQRALMVYQQVLVSNHPQVGYILEEYAFLLLKRGRVLQAAQIYQQALKAVGVRKALQDFWEGVRIYGGRIVGRRR